LGVTPEVAAKIGLRLYKIGMPWPLEPEGARQFAVGLEEIMIVEERREIVENQVKQELFNWRDAVRPRIVGKMDEHDNRFLPFAGIGCHFMALWMNGNTETYTHMGGEGVPWVGVAPFTDEEHVFANLGDGTYFHSGSLAIRQAIASKANITYKILYNDATAMTGGQHVDGELSPQQITYQLHSEGIREIYLVSENPDTYPASEIAPGTKTAHRDVLDDVQKKLRKVKGASASVVSATSVICPSRPRARCWIGPTTSRSVESEAPAC